MKWAFLHIIVGNVKSYPMFPGAYSEGVGKVALITWLKPGRAWGYLSLIQATKLTDEISKWKAKYSWWERMKTDVGMATSTLYNGHCSIVYNWENLEAT